MQWNEPVTCPTAVDKLREVTVDPIVTLRGFTGIALVIENDKGAGCFGREDFQLQGSLLSLD
jgi:hypothetical protein